MNIDTVAGQIRMAAPIFAGNVAGAAAYAHGVADQVWLPLPAAYVIPLEQEAEDSDTMNGLQQTVRERVGVIVVLETAKIGGVFDISDRRGQAASAYLDTVKYGLFSAILNWRPDWDPNNPAMNREARGLYFVSAGFPDGGAFDRSRFFYQFTFCLDTTLTDADGWQPPSDPLTDISSTITNPTTGLPTGMSFDVQPPQ